MASASGIRVVQLLTSPKILQDSQRLLDILTQIPDMIEAKTIEVQPLISPMVKLVASHNAKIKGLACDFLCQSSAEHPEIGLLVVNILNQDLVDPNPMVRSTAISTICILPGLPEHAIQAIATGLKDSNPQVRKSAVVGCGKLWSHSPDVVIESGLVDTLYATIRDPDPTVMTFTMQTLNYILETEGGIVISKQMAQFLMKRLTDLPEVEFCFVLEYLGQKFKPENDEIRIQFMNALDPYIGDKYSGPVVLSTSKVFYSLVQDHERLTEDFLNRLRPQITRLMKSKRDFQCQLLDFICDLQTDHSQTYLRGNFKDFFVRSKDSQSLMQKKARVLAILCDKDNCTDIIGYLLNQMKIHALKEEFLRSACEISHEHPLTQNLFLKELAAMLVEDRDIFAPVILRLIRRIVPRKPIPDKANEDLLKSLCSEIEVFDFSSRIQVSNLLWIIRNYCDVIEDSPYIMEFILEEKSDELKCLNLLNELLMTCVKVFIANPPQSQVLLGEAMELCQSTDKPEIERKISFYGKLLTNPDLAQSLFSKK